MLALDDAYSDEWWMRHDRLEDHTPADEIEAVPPRVRRRYAEPEQQAQAACRPLASGVHVQPVTRTERREGRSVTATTKGP